MNGPKTKRKSRAGFRIDQLVEGKFRPLGSYREGQVMQLTTETDAHYRLRDSQMNFTLFDLRVGETALVKGLSYRVLPYQSDNQEGQAEPSPLRPMVAVAEREVTA